MRRIYAEQRGATGDTEHNKFFEFILDSTRVIFRWGAIGCRKPSESTIEDPDQAKLEAVFNKKLKEKTGRKNNPYVIIERSDPDSENAPVHVEARPSDEGRRWGLEVETHSDLNIRQIADNMRRRGLEVNVETTRYFHSTGSVWDVKRDGSCGYEFASPILSGEAGIFDAKLAVEKIRDECQTAVNSNCGIHVTVDVSDFNDEEKKRLVIMYLKAQEHFFAQCNASRQNNRYCMRNPTAQVKRIITTPANQIKEIVSMAGGWSSHDMRYHGLNFTRLFTIGVVEFRMMESSVAIRKVGAWVRTCVGFVDGVKKCQVKFATDSAFSNETFNRVVNGTYVTA